MMTRMTSLPTVPSLLLILLLQSPGGVLSTCLFPDFVQTGDQRDDQWLYRVHNQASLGLDGRDANLFYVTFTSSVMQAEANVGSRVRDKPQPYTRLCLNTSDSDLGLFIVQHQFVGDGTDGEITFACMTFHHQSENVVLISESPRQLNMSDDICEEMELQHWPLVAFKNTQLQHIPEGAVGGYDVTVVDMRSGDIRSYCDDVTTGGLQQSRLEIGCPPRSAITLSIPFDCLPDGLLMDSVQNLISLGSWTMSNNDNSSSYSFMLLTTPPQHQNKLWCLRMPVAPPTDDFDAYLFLDVVCDPSDEVTLTENVLTLGVTRRAVSTVCNDGHSQCEQALEFDDVCDDELVFDKCMKSCNNCATALGLVEHPCIIPSEYRGTWQEVTQYQETDFSIEKDTITIGNFAPFHCIHQDENEDSRFPVVYTSQDGCFPRFSCIELGQRGPGVLKYKLAQTHSWPESVFELDDGHPLSLCEDSRFSGEVDPMTGRFTYPVFSNMVSTTNRTPVPCDVAEHYFSFDYHTTVDYDNIYKECTGRFFTPCSDHPTTISVSSNNNDCDLWNSKQFTCIASFKGRDGDHIVLTESLSRSWNVEFHCWIFKHTLQDLIVLPSSDCHEKTRVDIEQYRVDRSDMALFAIQWSVDQSTCEETTVEEELTTEWPDEGTTLDPLDGVGCASTQYSYCGVLCLQAVVLVLMTMVYQLSLLAWLL